MIDRLLLFAMGVLVGAALVSQGARRATAEEPGRFAPGRYLIEPAKGADEDAWIVNYTTPWYVHRLPLRPEK